MTRERKQRFGYVPGSPEIALPWEILKLQEIPLLGTGKVNYVRLKEEALRAPAVAPSAD